MRLTLHECQAIWFSICFAYISVSPAQSPPLDSFDPRPSDYVWSTAVDSRGKVLLGGSLGYRENLTYNFVGRFNPDGSFDPSFNAHPDNQVIDIAIQPNGKILITGSFIQIDGQKRLLFARVNSDGTLDLQFNPSLQAIFTVNCPVVGIDGKILICGHFSTVEANPRHNLVRLNPDGSVDSDFRADPNGVVSTMMLQPDGKIIFGGDFTEVNGVPAQHLARINADGTLDATFSPPMMQHPVPCIALQADGRILFGPYAYPGTGRTGLGRLNSDGTVDLDFYQGAYIEEVKSMVLYSDGKISAAGTVLSSANRATNLLIQLNWDGLPDPDFTIMFDMPERPRVNSLALQADGKLLFGGSFTNVNGQSRLNAARLHPTRPATQTLSSDDSSITWLRGGSSPEVWRTTFEHSTDGTNWILLGHGSRIPGGWRLSGISVPPTGPVRARGFTVGGVNNGSSWFVETLWNPMEMRLEVHREGEFLNLRWAGGQGPFQVEQSSDITIRDSWRELGAAVITNSISIPLSSGTMFLRVRGQ